MFTNRTACLLVVCGGIFLPAMVLRLASHRQDRAVAAVAQHERRNPVDIAQPRDYAEQPVVAAREHRQGPRRIVSLAPNATETLCALGLADRLVGRTQFCTYPPDVLQVRSVGGLMDTNLELIRALQPELVVTTVNSRQVNAKLTAVGLHHVSLPHESLDDVFAAIEQAGAACGRPETAHRLSAALRSELAELHRAALGLHERPLRVLLAVEDLPVPPTSVWVAGPGSFPDALLRLSGHVNAVAGEVKTPFGQIPLERLLVLNPDVILTFPDAPWTAQRIPELCRAWRKVGPLSAIRDQKVRAMGGAEWGRAGPRIALALHRFITVLSEFR